MQKPLSNPFETPLENNSHSTDHKNELVPVLTEDGSSTFYSQTFGEWFHSRKGAYNEAQQTYVKAANITQRAQSPQLNILDICYGLGYNTAAALDEIRQMNAHCQVAVKALELDVEVPRRAIAHNLLHHYSAPTQQVLHSLATNHIAKTQTLCAELLLGDARQQIQRVAAQNWLADVIFFDPFSPPHCPQLWTVEFFQQVAQRLNTQGGVLVTYSCAAAVRAAMKICGLLIGEIPAGGRQWPGTIAWHPQAAGPEQQIGTPLSQQAKEHLQTRAAVPYRDPSLCDHTPQILERRQQEQLTSNLLSTGPWRKHWKAMAAAKHVERNTGH
ncbi:MAG: MnmC family methyltransferase [Cyanobacteria bacterium J06627_28]